jgi:hypothetical protein
VLAVATFSSVKSANRSARVAERSLSVGLRPVLIPSREEDPVERIRFGDEQLVVIPGHGAAVEVGREAIYLAIALRNGGQGLAVLHGWRVQPRPPRRPGSTDERSRDEPPGVDEFRRQQLDLYIPAGDTGYWQGAMRDPSDAGYAEVRRAALAQNPLQIDLLYGDHEGGQRTIVRFVISPWPDVEGERAYPIRYWNVDEDDPR